MSQIFVRVLFEFGLVECIESYQPYRRWIIHERVLSLAVIVPKLDKPWPFFDVSSNRGLIETEILVNTLARKQTNKVN